MSTQTRTGQTTWTIDPAHSQIGFSVRHMMISNVKGAFGQVEGRITLDEAHPANASVEVSIDARSIDTRNEDRDTHLRSEDFLHVDAHPAIHFHSTRIDVDDERGTIEGELSIRGVSRPITLEVEKLGEGTDPWGQDRMAFRAEARVNRKDYGLTWNQALEAGGVLVGDEVRISIEVQAVLEESGD